jgi:hypothetical protein
LGQVPGVQGDEVGEMGVKDLRLGGSIDSREEGTKRRRRRKRRGGRGKQGWFLQDFRTSWEYLSFTLEH